MEIDEKPAPQAGVARMSELHGRFETMVALLLGVVMALVVFLSLLRIGVSLADIVRDPSTISEFATFQRIFGMVMVTLIALEFGHIILRVAQGQDIVSQMQAVIVIALLALVRKFILLEVSDESQGTILALSAAVLSLGAVYWVIWSGTGFRRSGAVTGKGDGSP